MHRPLPQMDGSWCHSSRVDQETSYANACGTGHVTDAQGEELSHSTSPCFQESLESTNLANRPPGHCKGVPATGTSPLYAATSPLETFCRIQPETSATSQRQPLAVATLP